MVDALVWLLSVELLGLLALPLAFLLFQRLPDRGFTVAKPLVLALSSYVLWVLGLSHLAPNSQATIIGILAGTAIVGGLILRRQRDRLRIFFRSEWRTLLVAEGVFLGFFLLWAGIVSEIPAINHTEKPMDFAFLNAVAQSRFFPPEDPWLAGHPISYYYFGHFTMAFLTQLTGIASNTSYNLSISLIPALVAAGAFGLVHNLVRLSGGSRAAAFGFGLAAPALLLLAGNLEGALEFVRAQGWGGDGFWSWVAIDGLEGGAASSGAFPDAYNWWWHATRVINTFADGQSLDYTITEFPVFSFLLGDLHAHVVSLPFVVLGLSLGLNLFLSPDRLGLGWLRRHPVEAMAVALFLGSLAFINAWDFPLLAVVLGVLVLAKSYGQENGGLQRAAGHAALMLFTILVVAVALFLPYYLSLARQFSGDLPSTGAGAGPILILLAMGLFLVLAISFLLRQLSRLTRPPARPESLAAVRALVVALTPLLVWIAIASLLATLNDSFAAAIAQAEVQTSTIFKLTEIATRPFLFFLVMGLFFFMGVSFLLRQLAGVTRPAHREVPAVMLVLVVALMPLLVWLAIVLFQVNITGGVSAAIAKAGARALWVLPGLAIVALAGFSGLQRVLLGRDPVVAFPLFLMAVAFYLLVGVEMFHVVDPFGNRMNTVFKVYYQVWLLLALVGAYGLYYWYAHPKEAVRPAAELPDAAWLEKRRALRLGWHAWTAATAVLLLASLYYPVGAVLDRTGLLEQGHSFSDNTLDGLDFLNSNSRGEYVAIQWLRDQAPWGRIVEAVGDDYSEYGRISASTGLPTVLGWKGHELQWRGGTRLLDGREEDIATIYRSEDGEEVGRLLERYEVRYVYLGRRERASYGGRHLADFDGILRTVFQQDGVIIYELVRGSGQGVPGDDERGPG